MASPTTSPEPDIWDEQADVVVVGGGAAGFGSALAALDRGVSVLMLERARDVGGTTAKSGGQFWIPNNSLMRGYGIEDPRAPMLRYMARLAYPHLYDPDGPTLGLSSSSYELIAAFYDHASRAVDRMIEMGALRPELDLVTPSYHADLDDDLAPYGRSLVPFGKPKNRADGTGGEVLIRGMESAARARGLRILLEHRAATVLRNDVGEVVGLEARVGRRTVLVRSRLAVVFCSGGFLHDHDLRTNFLRGPVFGGCAADTSTGDFVRIGLELGTQLGNMNNAWWNQCVVEVALRTPSTIRDVWMPFGDSMIQVNRYGRRVVNEKMPYNERAQVHFQWNPTTREYTNLLLFMVYDEDVARHPSTSSFREPVPPPGESAQYVISGDTWENLAANIDRRLEELAPRTGGARLDASFASNLRGTVARYDGFAALGRDEDFGRGETPIQLAWGAGDRGAPNPTMHPFRSHGPYHCIILGGGSLDTKGGPRINPRAQVLDVGGSPIPGLYGAGNCIASPAGQAYWAAGGTIGPALTFGFIAGSSAADEKEKPVG
jgi:succinate dehydrogenase/fumarate reductase flavoprotein subunit